MSIWQWPQLYESTRDARITLGEGNTPFIRSRRIGPAAGLPNLFFKLEATNPSGSYKDRFAAAAVSQMILHEKRRCIATSSGNTGSALAAYCAAAGIACEIAVVEPAPDEKLKQMAAYGAKIFKIKGFGTDSQVTEQVLAWVKRQGERPDSALQISAYHYSPLGMAGVQSISYELAEQSPEGLDDVFVPAGGGGLTLAIARGFATLLRPMSAFPRIHCVQPEGNDTIATPLRIGESRARSVACTTKIGGLQVATVIDGHDTLAACRATGGTGHIVTDESVWAMQKRLAREEGIFCEPAAAVAVVAALAAATAGIIASNARICCILTGIGFKDMPSIDRMLNHQICPLLSVADLS